jgi:integrase
VASLWKHPDSRFHVACFTVHEPTGRKQWKRSLKTEDRKLARRISDALEEAGRGAMREEEINSFVEKIGDARSRLAVASTFKEVFRVVTGRDMGAGSLRAFSDSWLEGIRGEIAPQSYLRYSQVTREFIAFAGPAADRDIMSFGRRDDLLILGFRDELAKRVSANSVNTNLKIVRQMFKAAAQRYKIDSPARDVGGLKVRKADTDRRRGFTLPELGRILREARGSEWEGIVLAGLYTGQRLADIATLRWENVDLLRAELALTTRKTNRRILVPLASPLADYLSKLPATDDPAAFVFPLAAGFIEATRAEQTVTLSGQFREILVGAGLVRRQSHAKAENGKGRSARRKASELSFHSFRHTATSLLKNAGVPQSVVMDIIGHESKAISQIYTHTGDEARRSAIDRLPSVDALLNAAEESESPQVQAGERRTERGRKGERKRG